MQQTSPPPSSNPSLNTVLAQEQLLPQVAALLKQVAKLPPRQSQGPASPVMLAAANQLFVAARSVLGRAAPDPVGDIRVEDLSVMLAALNGALEGFETRHSWVDRQGLLVWRLADGGRRPVARHLGKWLRGPNGFPISEKDPDADERHARTLRRILERENQSYLAGYRDCLQGLPPRADLTVIDSIDVVNREDLSPPPKPAV